MSGLNRVLVIFFLSLPSLFALESGEYLAIDTIGRKLNIFVSNDEMIIDDHSVPYSIDNDYLTLGDYGVFEVVDTEVGFDFYFPYEIVTKNMTEEQIAEDEEYIHAMTEMPLLRFIRK